MCDSLIICCVKNRLIHPKSANCRRKVISDVKKKKNNAVDRYICKDIYL